MRIPKMWILLLPVGLVAAGAVYHVRSYGERKAVAVRPNPAPVPEKVSFNAHIRPIFSDTCFACHGFDQAHRKADLRLDTSEGAYAKLKDSEERAIVPGKPEESAVWQRIASGDPEVTMPPPDFHKVLAPEQKELVRRWIEEGAEYQDHWAFAPVERPPVPHVAAGSPVRNPIDAFIIERLEKEKLAPSPEADRPALLRRLSLDLTGLPPTPEEIAAFAGDADPDAYEKQVDRLLASPHYGERMAVPWLDVVRFADTVGYHGDQNQRIFPYRDYVIRSFNTNKPFDQFTIEQVAGDLLPGATEEQRIATGFLRLNLMTREGGAQPAEYLAKYAADRVRSIGAAWLGLTTGCAECHDHKFDPMTARDFHALGAFFDDLRQWGVYSDYKYTPTPELKGFNNEFPFPPELHAPSQSTRERLLWLQDRGVAALADAPGAGIPGGPDFASWVNAAAALLAADPDGWLELVPSTVTATAGSAFEIDAATRSVLFEGPPAEKESLALEFPLPDAGIRSIRIEVLPDPAHGGKVGRQPDGRFAVTPVFAIDQAPLAIAWSQADRRTPERYKNGESSPWLEARWVSAPAPAEEPGDAASRPHHAIYHLATPLPPAAGRVLKVKLESSDIGRVRVSVTPFGDAVPGEVSAPRARLAEALRISASPQSEDSRRELSAAWVLATTPDAALPADYRAIREEIIACRAGYAHSMIARSLPPEQRRVTRFLPRGNWMEPGEIIEPALPVFLAGDDPETGGNGLDRLDLARWLVAADNPLTPRHFTNRLWKQFFGKGLSNVLDDLGSQGEWPSHPELLDWLAAEFRDSGWDMKHMVRLIVTSHTYRQRSAAREDLAPIDPANRWLSEQSPRRLDAEFVRDNALAIAGLLDTRFIGGPSVKPYQPPGYYANLNFPQRDYTPDTNDGQYRRGLYMHWQRTFMHPMLAAFDAPSREECAADRLQSNGPQQALVQLNDPTFVEAARAFALRILRDCPADEPAARITRAFRLALGRDPKPGEIDSLTAFLATQMENHRANPEETAAFLKTGLSTQGDPARAPEIAAWTQVCRVILNLHETITRY